MSGELSPAERGLHTEKRAEVYEAINGKAKANCAIGMNKKLGNNVSANLADTFVIDTASKTGRSERAVRRDRQRGKIKEISDVIGTCLDKGEELDALAKLPDDRRKTLIERASAGEKVSAKTEAKKASRDAKEMALAAHDRGHVPG